MKKFDIAWWRTHFDEDDIASVVHSIKSECISMGKVTEEFEQKIADVLNVPYVVATSSGSTALTMALMAIGIDVGDEVIVPNRTWIATAHAPAILGAKVVLVDVLPNIPIIDASKIEEKITSRTKAIIPVSLNGRGVNMPEILKIADKHGLAVIEDAAQSFLAKEKGSYAGTMARMGCFSLSVAKLIPTGQGGFVVTSDSELYKQLKRIRTHGIDDVINCEYHQLGFNFRITDLQSSLGITQLAKASKRIAAINEIYAIYQSELSHLKHISLIPSHPSDGEIPLYIEALSEKREALINYLANKSIQTRPFYPNLDTAKYLNAVGEFPSSRIFSQQGLFLPSGPAQTHETIYRVCNEIKEFDRLC